MRSQRGQYGGEGLIVSVISALIGIFFLLIARIPNWYKNPISMRVALIIFGLLAFFAINLYVSIYRIKSPWYSHSFLPPRGFTRGPMWRDQGNNI